MPSPKKTRRVSPRFNYETLEAKRLLAITTSVDTPPGTLALEAGLSQFDSERLIYNLPNPVPVEQRTELLNDFFRLTNQDSFRKINQFRDQLGMGHIEYQQYFNGIPVEGAFVTIHTQSQKAVRLSGEFIQPIVDPVATVWISEQLAFESALRDVNASKYIWDVPGGELSPDAIDFIGPIQRPSGNLVYLKSDSGALQATYKFDIYGLEPVSRDYVFVDVHSGQVVKKHNRIEGADVIATGTSLYNGTVEFLAEDTGTEFRLRQQTDGVETYDLNNDTYFGRATDITSPTIEFTDPDVHKGVQAHYVAEQTLKYFRDVHGRDSFDDQGSTLRSYVSYDTDRIFIYWNGEAIFYGDGNGTTVFPTQSIDLGAHEFTHGISQHTARLFFEGEPGSLRESFSDIFGEVVENYVTGSNDWLIGADIRADGQGYRSLSNPKSYNDPDTYHGDYWHDYVNNSYGNWNNAGVPNKWFYILSEGEQGTNDKGTLYDVPGIGMDDAALIAYRNLTVYLDSYSDFQDARSGAIQSAIDLFGADSQQLASTIAAWDAVGVSAPQIELDFQRLPMSGSLAYQSTHENLVLLGSDDEFSIPLAVDDNSMVSVVVEPTFGNLAPSISIIDSNGTTIHSTTGVETTYLLDTPLTAEEQYSLVIKGDSGTFGDFNLLVLLNSTLEPENFGGPGNDTMESAQSLEASSISIGTNGAEILNVIGKGSIETEIIYEDFEYALGPEWERRHAGAEEGEMVFVRNYDGTDRVFQGKYSFAMGRPIDGDSHLNEFILTVDLESYDDVDLSFNRTYRLGQFLDLPPSFTGSVNGDGIALSSDGETWHTLTNNSHLPWTQYLLEELDLTQEVQMRGVSLTSQFKIKFQQYGRYHQQILMDDIALNGFQSNEDWFSFELGSNQSSNVRLELIDQDEKYNTLVDVYDSDGNLIESGVAENGVFTSSILSNNNGTAQSYFIKIDGRKSDYILSVLKDTAYIGKNQELPSVIPTATDFNSLGFVHTYSENGVDPDSLGAYYQMDRAQQGVFIEHFDSIVDGGNVLSYYATYASTGSFAFAPRHFTFYDRPYHNFDQFRKFRASFDELQSDVSIDVVAKDRAERGRLRAYDANDNLLEEKFSNYLWEETHETVTISRPQNDIAYVEAWGTHFLDNLVFGSREIDQDLYTIDVNSPTRLDFSTILPGAGPLGFHNGLDLPAGSDLRMELLDPDGNVVATSTSDLIHDAIEIGTYQLRIYAETTYGEYILQSNPSPIIPRFFDVTPEFGSIAEGFLGVATQPYLPERQFGWTDSTGLGILS